MANKNSTAKPEKAVINLGGIELEVFSMPDGEYLLSRTQALEVVEFFTKDLPRFLKSKGLDGIPCMALNLPPFLINGGKVKPFSISQAATLWAELAYSGNGEVPTPIARQYGVGFELILEFP